MIDTADFATFEMRHIAAIPTRSQRQLIEDSDDVAILPVRDSAKFARAPVA
jgi:hypothetical protein